MKKLFFTTIIFSLFFLSLDAQISAGTLKVVNMGSFYRISAGQPLPFNNVYPKPDSASLRITVICPQTLTHEVNHLPLNGHVDYKLGGLNYIGMTVIWWKNGVKKSQTSVPTFCGFFLNPLNCFQKQ